MAVNDAYLVAPWAEVSYFADARWWKWHADGVAKSWPWAAFTADQVRHAFRTFAGQKCSIGETGLMIGDPEVFLLKNGGSDGLSTEMNSLRTGSNSGYQAINLAVLAGAAKVLLVGYDMRFHGKRSHSHDGHQLKTTESVYLGYARTFGTMLPGLKALGVDVANCTPGSAVKAFRNSTLGEEL